MVDFLKELVNSGVWRLYEPYLISIVLGGLVGIEREYKKQKEGTPSFGGIRTFMLIALTGTISAHLASIYGSPLLYAVLASVTALLVVAQVFERLPGLTSEISAIVTFLVGVLCYRTEFQLASAIAVATLFILSFKEQMHDFVKHLRLEDLFALLKFTAVTVIIYPLLPDISIGGVNPREVWTMVVVISTVDFVGYILTKLVGERGILITGLIGGIVSSTAVTATFSSLAKANQRLMSEYGAGIIGASAIMFPRMALLASIVDVKFAKFLFVPALFAFGLGIFFAYRLSSRGRKSRANVDVKNPYELSTAIKFGLFYAFVLFFSVNALKVLGDYGLYAVAAVSGLSDVDAITLSVSKLFSAGELSIVPGVIAILLAAASNTLFKWFLTFSMGGRELFKLVTPGFIALIVGEVVGIAILIMVG
jgi:uncharacterized membrane protein (DUF4010 family)